MPACKKKVRQKSLFVKFSLFLFIFLLSVPLIFSYPVCAQGGERSDSPGIPGQKPLSFTSISLMDGGKVQDADDVPIEPEFKLQFDKNVVNSTIWEINRNCFSLFTESGENLPVRVNKIDDSIDFTQRHIIFVKPAEPLSPGTSYSLKISPDLKAKNGVSVLGGTTAGQGVTISFKTAGEAVPKPAAQPAAQPEDEAETPAAAEPETQQEEIQAESQTQPAEKAAEQPVVKPADEPENPPAPSGELEAGQASKEAAQPQAEAVGTASSSDAGASDGRGADNAGAAEDTDKRDEQVPEAEQGDVAASTSGDNTGETSASPLEMEQENPAGAGAKLNFTDWMTVLAIILIIGWIIVEVIVKKRKESL